MISAEYLEQLVRVNTTVSKLLYLLKVSCYCGEAVSNLLNLFI